MLLPRECATPCANSLLHKTRSYHVRHKQNIWINNDYEAKMIFPSDASQKESIICGDIFVQLRMYAGLELAEASNIGAYVQRDSLSVLNAECIGREGRRYVLESFQGNVIIALAALVDTAVRALSEDLGNISRLSGLALKKVAFVGAWAGSTTFCQWLEETGIQVVVPPKATRATLTGMLAHDLAVPRLIASDHGSSFTKVLRCMEPKELVSA